MARKVRISPPGIPQHVQRAGADNRTIFADDEDKRVYYQALLTYAQRYQVTVHAWVIMDKHVQVLCTPATNNGISQMLQATGRIYVPYFNQKYQSSGGIWYDRFKSTLILDDEYYFNVQHFIEFTPVREGCALVADQYMWSSYRANALGVECKLTTPHRLYQLLASHAEDRKLNYIRKMASLQNSDALADITEQIAKALKMNLALGSDGFIQRLEKATGRRLSAGKVGRPRKTALHSPE